VQVSVIGVGTWQFGGEWGRPFAQADVDAILDTSAECGINLIDTAECYGDHLSERLIGDYLRRRDRSRWLIATKFGHHFHGFLDRTWHLAAAEVAEQLDASLRALGVETIDLYQFHSGPNDAFQNQELWSMLQAQQRAGKIRSLGVSISSKSDPLQAREARRYGAEVLQVVYNRLDRRAEWDFFPAAAADDLGVLARVPLASSFLSGKYNGSETFPKNDMRSTLDAAQIHSWLEEVKRIKGEELPQGMPLAQWALAWCLKQPIVSAVIPGCKDPGQVKQNAAAAGLQL
jgi:aryl-alcohol dehydrogenase-like predicted oxidoreductase